MLQDSRGECPPPGSVEQTAGAATSAPPVAAAHSRHAADSFARTCRRPLGSTGKRVVSSMPLACWVHGSACKNPLLPSPDQHLLKAHGVWRECGMQALLGIMYWVPTGHRAMGKGAPPTRCFCWHKPSLAGSSNSSLLACFCSDSGISEAAAEKPAWLSLCVWESA